jgi:hypothetical protein
MYDLENLLLAYFDGYSENYTIEEENDWCGTDHVFKVHFTNRDRFNEFTNFVNGRWNSWHEDDHNFFDLKPFLIDIGYSDMVIIFQSNVKNPNW